MSREALGRLFSTMAHDTRLPRLAYHFDRHGAWLGAATIHEFDESFVRHIGRDSLRRFTSIRHKGRDRMWYVVEVVSGEVAQYNESRARYWSFFRAGDIDLFLEAGRGLFVEVVATGAGWEARPW